MWRTAACGGRGPLGYLNQVSPAGVRGLWSDRRIPTPTITCCSAPAQRNSAVIAKVGNFVPYPGYSTSQHAAQRSASVPAVQYHHCDQNSPTGKTWYDSLQMKGTKRVSHGLQVNGTFTWSKAMVGIRPNLFVPSNKSLEPTDQPFSVNANILYTTQKYELFSNKSVAGNQRLGHRRVSAVWQRPAFDPAGRHQHQLHRRQRTVPGSGQPLFIKNLNCGCINPYSGCGSQSRRLGQPGQRNLRSSHGDPVRRLPLRRAVRRRI